MNRQLFASLFCSVFVCVACSGAYAGDAAGDDRKVDCNDATSTYEINECSEREFEAADKALNDIYGQAIAYIKKSESEAPYRRQTLGSRLARQPAQLGRVS